MGLMLFGRDIRRRVTSGQRASFVAVFVVFRSVMVSFERESSRDGHFHLHIVAARKEVTLEIEIDQRPAAAGRGSGFY